MSRPLTGRVALVAGATRGAGRAIAVELARAGAYVYATGRSSRTAGRSEMDRPETIEETGELMRDAAGTGSALRVDHLEIDEVTTLVQRIDDEHGRLDVLVNDIFGGDRYAQGDRPLWEHDLRGGLRMLRIGVDTHLITSTLAIPLLLRTGGGLVIEMTDGTSQFNANYREGVGFYYDLVKANVDRIVKSLTFYLAKYAPDGTRVDNEAELQDLAFAAHQSAFAKECLKLFQFGAPLRNATPLVGFLREHFKQQQARRVRYQYGWPVGSSKGVPWLGDTVLGREANEMGDGQREAFLRTGFHAALKSGFADPVHNDGQLALAYITARRRFQRREALARGALIESLTKLVDRTSAVRGVIAAEVEQRRVEGQRAHRAGVDRIDAHRLVIGATGGEEHQLERQLVGMPHRMLGAKADVPVGVVVQVAQFRRQLRSRWPIGGGRQRLGARGDVVESECARPHRQCQQQCEEPAFQSGEGSRRKTRGAQRKLF